MLAFLVRYKLISTVLAASLLSGCGTYVPNIQAPYESPHDAQIMIDAIVQHVQCEVRTAVQFLILDDIEAASMRQRLGLKQKTILDWLYKWAAQVTLTLTMDEKTSLNPGVTFNNVMPNAVSTFGKSTVTTPQIFTLGLGGTLSADATRKEILSLFMDFKTFTDKASLNKAKLLKARFEAEARKSGTNTISPCTQQNGVFIQSDLKLRDWLYAVALPAAVEWEGPQYVSSLEAEAKKSKKDVISHEVTFVIIAGGNITPAWKLLRVSANQGALPFFGVQRTDTQDLVITMGPAFEGELSTAAQNTVLAAQIGQAVANAIRNTQ